MEITKESIEARKNKLVEELNFLQSEIAKAQSNANAYLGAIEDCDYWLAKLAEIEKIDNKDSPV